MRVVLIYGKLTFPEEVPFYSVRKDVVTGEDVKRGLLNSIGVGPPHSLFAEAVRPQGKVTVKEMQSLLQCSPHTDSHMDGNRGGLGLLKMAPPTRETVENICAFFETKCDIWSKCKEAASEFLKADKPEAIKYLRAHPRHAASLIRIINGHLYTDWPWTADRYTYPNRTQFMLHDILAPVELVLRAIETKDNVFFFGGEAPKIQFNIPFPAFSFASSLHHTDFVLPWREPLFTEWANYEGAAKDHNNYTDEFFRREQTPWREKQSKAAFYASMAPSRHMVFDQAVLRPDLIVATFGGAVYTTAAWNPLSDEPRGQGLVIFACIYLIVLNHPCAGSDPGKEFHAHRNHTGFLQYIWPLARGGHYKPTQYKYVVVCLGAQDQSTSGRLSGLLAHSGSVVMLQESEFQFHFSDELKPWVHYVPLAYNSADLIEKVEWLKAHDDLAQKIAINAANFGKSYLRLEDFYCYMANSLEVIAGVLQDSDVLQPFNATII